MHEIITLQLGQRSNYLATHFWNTQESYFTYSGDDQSPVDHDVHFRPGVGADGSETFTPRTLIYDLKGAFGSLRKINALYEMQEEKGMPQGLWDGPTIVQKQPAIEESPYQTSLNDSTEPSILTPESVRYWSDFNRVFYHPRSIVQLMEYELHSSLMPFERWDVGEDLFSTLDKEHDLVDRDLRPFAEECDQLQGIQMMTGVDDAWGGFSARYLDRIRDEFGKTSTWVWGLEDGKRLDREKRLTKLANIARTLRDVSSQASVYVPIADPVPCAPSYVSLDGRSEWQSTSLISTAVESLTLPSRLKRANGTRPSLAEMGTALNFNGNQNIARLELSIVKPDAGGDAGSDSDGGALDRRMAPKPAHTFASHGGEGEGEHESRHANARLTEFDMDLHPLIVDSKDDNQGSRQKKRRTFTRVEVFRGGAGGGFDTNARIDGSDLRTGRHQRQSGDPIVQRYRSLLSYPLLDSFPPVLSTRDQDHSRPAVDVHAGLSTDSSIAHHIRSVRRSVGRGVGVEEREALANELGAMAEAYDEGWSSGSDEDDD
ncbi:MAG: mtDNA inheritance, partitioning of the mitochondrial organelle [Sclerophora amabilis]|nr:MAG: mtDNA inheritance, partitioning of the mitochondrial organelle [Sclerophora amabilis]